MLLNDFLKAQNRPIGVTTGAVREQQIPDSGKADSGNRESFADILRREAGKGGVEFSGHAMRRIESRNIDITENAKLDRLNRGVELAAQKGSSDALILVDSMAFVVSVRNNKVITTMETGAQTQESVFTNIDSTIIV